MRMEELATISSRGRQSAAGGAQKEKENCCTQKRSFFLVCSRLRTKMVSVDDGLDSFSPVFLAA
jgi:hypothetical protein